MFEKGKLVFLWKMAEFWGVYHTVWKLQKESLILANGGVEHDFLTNFQTLPYYLKISLNWIACDDYELPFELNWCRD